MRRRLFSLALVSSLTSSKRLQVTNRRHIQRSGAFYRTYCIRFLSNYWQMFAERFIVYTQTVEDVNGTVMGRVFKFAMDIPGLNFISIAMHSMTTDRFSACSAILLSFIYFVHQQERQGDDQRRCQVVSSHNWPVILSQHNQSPLPQPPYSKTRLACLSCRSLQRLRGLQVQHHRRSAFSAASTRIIVRRMASAAVNNYAKNLGSTAVRIANRFRCGLILSPFHLTLDLDLC